MRSSNFQNDYDSILLNNIDTTTERLPSNIISNIFINNPSKKDITYIQNINSIYTDSPKIIKNSNIYMNSPNIINASNLYPSKNLKNQIPINKSQNTHKANYHFLPRKKNNSQIFNTNNVMTINNESNNNMNPTNSQNPMNNIQKQMSEYFKTKNNNFYKKNNFSSEKYVIKNNNTYKNITTSFSNVKNQRIQSPLFFNKKNINTSSNKLDKNQNERISQRNWRKISKKDNINKAPKIKFSNEKYIPSNNKNNNKQFSMSNKRIFSPLNEINDYSSIIPLNKEKLANKKCHSFANDKKNSVKSLTTNNNNHNTSSINNKKNSSFNKINKKKLNIKTKITPRIEVDQKDFHSVKNFSSNNENYNPKVKKIVENIFQWKNLIENQKSKTSGYFHPMPENNNKNILKKNYSQKDNLFINQDNSLYQLASPKELITETENNITDIDNLDNNHKKYKNMNNIILQDKNNKINNIPFPLTNKYNYPNKNENLAYYTENEKILNNNINNNFNKNNDELCNIVNIDQDSQEEVSKYGSDNPNQNLNIDNILEIREKLKSYYDNKNKTKMSKTSSNFKVVKKENTNFNFNQNPKPVKAKEKIEDTLLKNNLLSQLLNENKNNTENSEVINEIITTNTNNKDVNSNSNSTPSFIKTDQKIINTNNNYYYANNNNTKMNYNFRKDIISNNYNFNKNKEIKSSGLNFDNKSKNIQNFLWSTTETNQMKTKINNEINVDKDNIKTRDNINYNVNRLSNNEIININTNDEKRKQDLMELLHFSSNLGK